MADTTWGLVEIEIIRIKHRSREAGLGITPKGLRASVDLALAGGGGITPKGLRALAASVVSGFGGLGITPKGLRASVDLANPEGVKGWRRWSLDLASVELQRPFRVSDVSVTFWCLLLISHQLRTSLVDQWGKNTKIPKWDLGSILGVKVRCCRKWQNQFVLPEIVRCCRK